MADQRGPMSDEDLQALRARLHNLNDTVQRHEVQIAEHGIQIGSNVTALEAVRRTAATGEQLQNAVNEFGLKLQLATQEMGAKLSLVHSDLDPIRRGIYWAVGMILAAVLTAILGLVIVKVKA
jgi:chromosome segregation ATPase